MVGALEDMIGVSNWQVPGVRSRALVSLGQQSALPDGNGPILDAMKDEDRRCAS